MIEKPVVLALFPVSPYLREQLLRRFCVVDLHEVTQEGDGWFDANGAAVSAVLTNGQTGCDRALLDLLPNLRIIAIYGVGFDKVDLAAAREHGVLVTNTPDILTDDVADLAVGLVICLLRGIASADRFLRNGDWAQSEYVLKTKVTGKRFGVVGLGRIGTAIAERLSVFGPVSYSGTRIKQVPWTFHDNPVSLARSCDVLIVACAANEHTRSLVSDEVLTALGASGYLVNIARGSVVDEDALIEALKSGRLGGAALDVFANEPNVPSELADCDRVVLTPHIGSATAETRRAMADAVLANLDAFFAGRPVPNEVN